MTSVSPALQGLVSAHAHSRQPASDGKDKGANFAEMVEGAEKPAQHGNPSAETITADERPAKRAFTDPTRGRAEQDKAPSQKPSPGKTTRGGTGADPAQGSDDAGAARSSSTAPFQDRLPLLMVLSDIRQYAASPGSGHADPASGGESGPEAKDGASVSSATAVRHGARIASSATAEAPQRSGRAEPATETGKPDPGRHPANSGPATDAPIHIASALGQAEGAQPETDAATSSGWKPSAATRTTTATQPVETLNQAKPTASAGKMGVVSQQSFPAPAQGPMTQTGSAVVEAITSDDEVLKAFSTASLGARTANSVAVPTHVLKIELHPSELGAVTANLRLSGEQLSIEMKPETHEAYRRLTADGDAIVKSMRALGFDVDKVTILQPSIAAHAASRADGNTSAPVSAGREQPSFQPGNSGGNNAGSGRQPGRNDSNGAQDLGRAAPSAHERAGDDMYI